MPANLQQWIEWAFRPADVPHRFASFILARQASRDLNTEITTTELEATMPFGVHSRNPRGSAYYLCADTLAKRKYEFKRYIRLDPILHPLLDNPCAAFEALAPQDQATILAWIKTSLVPIRRTRTVSELRYPCQVVTGLMVRDDHMRGALLTAGITSLSPWRFRCCLTDPALIEFRRKRREQKEAAA